MTMTLGRAFLAGPSWQPCPPEASLSAPSHSCPRSTPVPVFPLLSCQGMWSIGQGLCPLEATIAWGWHSVCTLSTLPNIGQMSDLHL
jgi:hypothetical protein